MEAKLSNETCHSPGLASLVKPGFGGAWSKVYHITVAAQFHSKFWGKSMKKRSNRGVTPKCLRTTAAEVKVKTSIWEYGWENGSGREQHYWGSQCYRGCRRSWMWTKMRTYLKAHTSDTGKKQSGRSGFMLITYTFMNGLRNNTMTLPKSTLNPGL